MDKNVYLKKLAEQTECYEEVVGFMKNFAFSDDELSDEARELIGVARKRIAITRRSLSSVEEAASEIPESNGDKSGPSEEGEGLNTKVKPSRAADEVIVEDTEGSPDNYNSRLYLRPHYQLEGLSVSLRSASRLPVIDDREYLLLKAKLAEQAERYDDMAAALKKFLNLLVD